MPTLIIAIDATRASFLDVYPLSGWIVGLARTEAHSASLRNSNIAPHYFDAKRSYEPVSDQPDLFVFGSIGVPRVGLLAATSKLIPSATSRSALGTPKSSRQVCGVFCGRGHASKESNS
jgi:hypothetical protein